jgi:hypothetical protein
MDNGLFYYLRIHDDWILPVQVKFYGKKVSMVHIQENYLNQILSLSYPYLRTFMDRVTKEKTNFSLLVSKTGTWRTTQKNV